MNKGTTIKDLALEGLFTDQEWSERKRHIATLKNFAGASVAAAKALAAIRDKKLYRPHKTLKEFCQRECGFTEQRLFQIISFSKIREALPEKTKPLVQSERQTRELKNVPEDQRAEVLDEATRFHTKQGEIPTAKAIFTAAAELTRNKEPFEVNIPRPTDALGRVVPKDALPYWNRRDEAKELLGLISDARVAIKDLSDTDLMWTGINLNGVVADLNSAYNRFAASVPAYVCPYCKGTKPEGCRCCKGRGCISRFMWNHAVPEEMKR